MRLIERLIVASILAIGVFAMTARAVVPAPATSTLLPRDPVTGQTPVIQPCPTPEDCWGPLWQPLVFPLQGPKGDPGGPPGPAGPSAYQVAVANGFTGTGLERGNPLPCP